MQSKSETIPEGSFDPLLAEVATMDEITFWCRQLAEHGLFISKGLESGRQELSQLGLENLINIGYELYDLWMNIFTRRLDGDDVPIDEFNDALDALEGFLMYTEQLANKTWIGYVFPDELKHYLQELDHVRRHLAGEISQEDLIAFWLDIHKDHAALFAHLLDPSEKEKFEESLLYQQLFANTGDFLAIMRADNPDSEINMYVDITRNINDFNNFTATLRELEAIGNLKSIIHPRLALHIHREGLRSLVELQL